MPYSQLAFRYGRHQDLNEKTNRHDVAFTNMSLTFIRGSKSLPDYFGTDPSDPIIAFPRTVYEFQCITPTETALAVPWFGEVTEWVRENWRHRFSETLYEMAVHELRQDEDHCWETLWDDPQWVFTLATTCEQDAMQFCLRWNVTNVPRSQLQAKVEGLQC